MRLLIKWLVVSLVIFLSPNLTSDISVGGMGSALWAALVYGVLFVLIGWLLWLFVGAMSIVPGILTFGLFFFLVPVITNAILLKLTAGMIGSFGIKTWTAAFLLSLVLTVIGMIVDPRRSGRERA